MKRLTIIVSIILVAVFFTTFSAIAGDKAAKQPEKATKEECITKTNEAASLIKEVGVEKALEKINDKNGPFVWKDTYVFCFEEDTYKIVGHAYMKKSMLGRSWKEWRDHNGKPIFQEFVKMAKEKGEGWVDYMHTKSAQVPPRPKTSFIMKVAETNLIVGAGIYQ